MDREPQTTWIKRGPHRSVSIRSDGVEGARVVKRFSAGGWLKRWGDRRRAQAEFRMLEQLRELGLRVPRAHEVRQVGDGWEVSCDLIPGARTLRELLREPLREDDGLHAAPELIARRLGELVGAGHAAGLAHGDLHAGNLLIDEAGMPWMIDFTHARLLASPRPSEAQRDLVGLAGETREFASLPLRRRFLVAWRRAIRDELALGPIRSFLESIESLAVERRRSSLIEHQDRWSRPSGVCAEIHVAGQRILVARTQGDTDDERRAACEQSMNSAESKAAWNGDQTFMAASDKSPRCETNWIHLGRAWQHRLPALLPLYLVLGKPSVGVYRAPSGSRPLPDLSLDDPDLRHSWSQLEAQLRDRGLRLAGLDRMWRAPSGELLLGPGCELNPATSKA